MYQDQSVAGADSAGTAARPTVSASGDHPFHQLLALEIAGLKRYAMSLTRDWHGAQDLVQETLAKAWASRARYVAGTNLRAWLNTILRNTFLSTIRKWREVEDADGALTAGLTQPQSQDHAVALAELLEAMTSLPPQQREALTLVGAAGFSIAEAADRLGCPIGTVKSRISRARTTLSARFMSERPHCGGCNPGTCGPRRRVGSVVPDNYEDQHVRIESVQRNHQAPTCVSPA